MGINCSFYGFLVADAERRTSATGRSWVRLRVGVGKAEAVQWIRITVLNKAIEAAATLKGEKKYASKGACRSTNGKVRTVPTGMA